MTSDRAERLKIVREIPDGDYNREVEIEATADGLRIDDYIVIPWEWIRLAQEAVGVKAPDVLLPKDAEADCGSSES